MNEPHTPGGTTKKDQLAAPTDPLAADEPGAGGSDVPVELDPLPEKRGARQEVEWEPDYDEDSEPEPDYDEESDLEPDYDEESDFEPNYDEESDLGPDYGRGPAPKLAPGPKHGPGHDPGPPPAHGPGPKKAPAKKVPGKKAPAKKLPGPKKHPGHHPGPPREHEPGGSGPEPGFGFGPDLGLGSGFGFGPGGGRGLRRGAGPGRRGRRGDVRAAILTLLAERPMHGYEMIREIAERSQDLWQPSPGSIYPTLQLLDDEGLIAGTETAGSKKLFELTEQGRTAAAKITIPPWEEITEGADAGQLNLRTALGQLVMAATQSAYAAGAEQRQRIVDILKKARREIYTLLAEAD
ncbi:MAG: hypothetical protein F6Q13_11930 [Mycobacterium sp.]|nr:MAG: hypothetical protein F6Q13_11930 [Mycobacterium sp.]